MTTNAISFVFEQTNESDSPTNMNISKTLTGNLLSSQDLEDYSLSITRLSIPTSELRHLHFSTDDNPKYMSVLKMYHKDLNSYQTYYRSIGNEEFHNVVYNSKEKIIEHLNRSLSNNFRQYFEDTLVSNLDMRPNTSTLTDTFTNVSNLGSDINISTAYTKFACHKLEIISPVTKNSGLDNQIIRLFIKSHDNIKQYLYVGTLGDFVSKSSKGLYYITEDSFLDWDFFNTNKDGHNDVKAYESYVKFKDAVFTPKCNIGIESNTTFSLTFQYKLHLYFSDGDYMPSQSPFISKVGNKLQLNLQNYYYKNNHQIGFTSFFNNSMDFTTVTKKVEYVAPQNVYFIQYDAMILNDADLSDLIILSQDTSTIEKLGNLSEIQLRSSALSSVSENIISNASVPISSNVLQEFTVFKDEPLGNQLLYSESNVPWRRINMSKILHQTRNIDFSIFASYENGASIQLKLNPSETWSVRLSFLRN